MVTLLFVVKWLLIMLKSCSFTEDDADVCKTRRSTQNYCFDWCCFSWFYWFLKLLVMLEKMVCVKIHQLRLRCGRQLFIPNSNCSITLMSLLLSTWYWKFSLFKQNYFPTSNPREWIVFTKIRRVVDLLIRKWQLALIFIVDCPHRWTKEC